MPELPDVTVYCEALERFVVGKKLEHIRLGSPFVLRSVSPPLSAVNDHEVLGVRRIGKRIVLELENHLFLVIHLMVAGRLRWRPPQAKQPRRQGLAAFAFSDGTLLFTEAGTKKRASLHLVLGEEMLNAEHDPGGLEVLESSLIDFHERLISENHTLKRSLTDPHLFSGIGNAYSDEILWEAHLSPMKWSTRLSADEVRILFDATQKTLTWWVDRLREENGENFPEKVTAFRPEMAVHGKFEEPCPHCGSPVQRIVYAENQANYCATCQTGGKLLKDRALSQILKDDWPQTVDGWEEMRGVGD